ncbi:hypothetical protein ACU686_25035 [Yinghuangia aomiensis]
MTTTSPANPPIPVLVNSDVEDDLRAALRPLLRERSAWQRVLPRLDTPDEPYDDALWDTSPGNSASPASSSRRSSAAPRHGPGGRRGAGGTGALPHARPLPGQRRPRHHRDAQLQPVGRGGHRRRPGGARGRIRHGNPGGLGPPRARRGLPRRGRRGAARHGRHAHRHGPPRARRRSGRPAGRPLCRRRRAASRARPHRRLRRRRLPAKPRWTAPAR